MGQECYRRVESASLFLTGEGLFLLYYTQGVPLLFQRKSTALADWLTCSVALSDAAMHSAACVLHC